MPDGLLTVVDMRHCATVTASRLLGIIVLEPKRDDTVMITGMQAVERGALGRVSNAPFPSLQKGSSPDPDRFRRMPPRTRWERFVAARAKEMRKLWRRFQRWRWAA
jgi:anti-sigma-K factor RskA